MNGKIPSGGAARLIKGGSCALRWNVVEESGYTYLRNPSLFDPYTRWVAKRPSGYATMLKPRMSHGRVAEHIMLEGRVQRFFTRLMPSLWAAFLANVTLGRQ
jgi:hypothetical protein